MFSSQNWAPMAQLLLIFCPNQAPFTRCWIASPCCLKPDIPHPIMVPSTQKPDAHTLLARTKLLWPSFCTFFPNQTSFACRQIASPCCLKPHVPHYGTLYTKPAHPHYSSQNWAPVALFCTTSTLSLYQLHHYHFLLLQYLVKCTSTCADWFCEVERRLEEDKPTGFIPHHSQMGMVCAGTGVGGDFPTCGLPVMNPNHRDILNILFEWFRFTVDSVAQITWEQPVSNWEWTDCQKWIGYHKLTSLPSNKITSVHWFLSSLVTNKWNLSFLQGLAEHNIALNVTFPLDQHQEDTFSILPNRLNDGSLVKTRILYQVPRWRIRWYVGVY